MKRKQTEITNDIKTRALKTIRLLEKEHSDAEIALTFKNPLELLISTILSAQCTDKRVNIVTKTLFKKYKTLEDYAKADIKELEQDIRSTGFYHNKARHIKKCCQMLIEKFGSQVPRTMEELLELPGVARKTANIVLSNGFGIVEGIAVDTHVRRLSERLGLTQNKNQHKIEQDLMKIVPKEMWMRFSDFLVFHGRRICMAKKPKCGECVLNKICPSAFTFS
ncbi:endonuclease III [Candidatus Bathyarchaeota archaeon]|nr:endonuclease III [Candidatus Bathyarchaeota archaeon]